MSLTSELRSNSRLRGGLVLIACIVWLYCLLDLRDHNALLLDQYKQAASQLARFNTQQKQTQWLARADEVQAALASAESRVWRHSSIGLAQAEQQDWLNQQLLQAKAGRYAVKIAETETGGSAGNSPDAKNEKSDAAPSDLNRVRAKIEFNTDQQVLHSLLAGIAGGEHQIVVESLIVKPQRTELTVSAWYTLQPAVGTVTRPPSSAIAPTPQRDSDKKI